MVPQELIAVYTEIVKNEPDIAVAGTHLLAFLEDVKKITQAVQEAVNAARGRAGLPPVA